MMIRIFYFILTISFLSCTNSSQSQSAQNDTIEVAKSIIEDMNSKKQLIKRPDTIFILKSKNINQNWPSQTNTFNMAYIERAKKSEDLVDLSPQSWNDKRTRIDFGKFIFNNDTANVTLGLYQFQSFFIYTYKLQKSNNGWSVTGFKKK